MVSTACRCCGLRLARFTIRVRSLSRWRREEAQEGGGKKAFTGQGIPRDEEVAQLRRENNDLREANDILKKAVTIFSVKDNRR